MADNLARKVTFNLNEKDKPNAKQRVSLNQEHVVWSGFEKVLLILGTLITLGLMFTLVSASVSATSAQHELTNVQQTVVKEQNKVSDLHQEIGELTSSARMNKIARSKGLTLIEKNIRNVH
ncbi:cell division protein FtsL [Lactobacillus sp. ESL0684]|uniref:cell division protein FtsL n=1 Tax=Lactobacillus sp. ESL0684 TaxID=2983213 RepID=UPI0023F71BF2|nr:cell division protein FtsL [Lactobacillus sp. ESL0684]WEV42898.1 cell division protein FtsL [Lactobacillus sp. ESL0684]